MTEHWIRFELAGEIRHGRLDGDRVLPFRGDHFSGNGDFEAPRSLAEVELLTPCRPEKMIGLWNNFAARAAHEGWARPQHPLYFVKTANCYLAPGGVIRQPAHYAGPVVFEGELAIVIGRTCHNIDIDKADRYIFGYTGINDVTARGVLKADPSFPQWSRAKSFDTFGPFGPAIARGIEPGALRVITRVNGDTRQDYAVADMFFSPREIVARLSRDLTLAPGDLIACGTSLGAGPMVSGDVVEIDIPGVGLLINTFV